MPDQGPLLRPQYLKGVEIMVNSHCPDSDCGSVCCAAENTKSHHAWEKHYLPEFTMGHPPEQMSYCVSLATGELFNLHWDPIVWLQASPVETNYTCNRTCTTGKKGESGNPGLTYSHSVYLLTPHSPASPGQHV